MQRLNGSKSSLIPQELLDDIASRFLFDAPDKDLKDPISLCFLTELAYWFYLDEYVEEDDSLNSVKFDSFALQLLQHVGIVPVKGTLEDMLQEFRDFKHRVPTYGALILDTDLSHVLLVQGFFHRASWGFPKGKINVEEEPHKCAIREVLEETGYDISSEINKNVYLETTIGEQKVRLYIIPGVSMSTEFVPRTKGEIKELKWFPVHQLPAHKNDRNFSKATGHTNMFYMVMPFVKPLREWLAVKCRSGSVPNDQKIGNGGGGGREARKRHRSLNANYETHQRYLHYNSPSVTTPSSDVAKSKSQLFFPSLLQEANFHDKSKTNADVSPRKRESKSRSKGKKNNYSDSINDDNAQQKFTFKSRGKSKGGHFNPNGNSTTSTPNNSGINRGGNTPIWNSQSSSNGFRCVSWQNFRINKKAINEALDKVWSGVTVHVRV